MEMEDIQGSGSGDGDMSEDLLTPGKTNEELHYENDTQDARPPNVHSQGSTSRGCRMIIPKKGYLLLFFYLFVSLICLLY